MQKFPTFEEYCLYFMPAYTRQEVTVQGALIAYDALRVAWRVQGPQFDTEDTESK